jgi:tetratricopeptide (TPR) repeat protein
LTALFAATQAECGVPEGKTTAIEHADKAFLNMNYLKADSIYTSELRRNPGNAETYWKLSRLQVSLGESAEHSTSDERLRYYRKAMEYAKTCIALDSTIAKGHSWYAASLAIMADKIGTKEKLTRAKEVKRELDTALRLNPNDETALSILGSYYREAASIGWFKRIIGNAFIGEVPKGNYDLAEKTFRKAISIDARIIRNYHELALIQLEKGQRDEAVRLMKTALDKPIIMGSDRKRIEEMRILLKKLSND